MGEAETELEMPDVDDVDFEVEDGQDGANAIEYTRTLKLEFAPDEVGFWFTQIENEMFTCQVKSQWLKRCVLVKNLPPKIQADVMSLLSLKKSEAGASIYKQIKDEILRIHAPDCAENFKKALGRVLVGLPSQLGQQLINDVCRKSVKLSCGCCTNVVWTLWTMQLPVAVRAQVADMKFDKDTYNKVFQSADKIYLSTKSTEMSSSVAAIVNQDPEVAAVGRRQNGRGNRNNRGGGRGSGGGGSNTNGGSSGSGGSKPNSDNNGGNNQGNGGRRPPRHSSNPPTSCCDNHYQWAEAAWFCLSPLTCPYKDKCGPRPEKKKKD